MGKKMLPKSYLKFIAASVVYEADLSKYAKIQLMRFIENSESASQLHLFLVEGKIGNPSECENVSEGKILKAALILAAALAAGKLVYNNFLTKAARACSGAKIADRVKCINQFKKKADIGKLATLKRESSKCNQTSNVKKCRNMFANHIKKIEDRIKHYG